MADNRLSIHQVTLKEVISVLVAWNSEWALYGDGYFLHLWLEEETCLTGWHADDKVKLLSLLPY